MIYKKFNTAYPNYNRDSENYIYGFNINNKQVIIKRIQTQHIISPSSFNIYLMTRSLFEKYIEIQ